MQTQADLGKNPMPSTKVDAFLEQFPWAGRYAWGDPIRQVYVYLIEPSLLSYEPVGILEKAEFSDEFGGGCYNRAVNERLYLLDADGEIFARKTETISEFRKYIFFGPRIVEKYTDRREMGVVDKTIADTLKPLTVTEKDSVRFILSYWQATRAMIIYKVPKNCTLSAWLEAEMRKERLQLRMECDLIDGKGASIAN